MAEALTPRFGPGAGLSAAFGGWTPWLDFLGRAACARVRASFHGEQSLLLRAEPISGGKGADGCWAVSDGVAPSRPMLIETVDGMLKGWMGLSSHGCALDDPDVGDRDPGAHRVNDALLEMLGQEIAKRAPKEGDRAPVEVELRWSGELAHWSWGGPDSPADLTYLGAEDLSGAWARIVAEPPGAADAEASWRSARGERRESMELKVTALTVLGHYGEAEWQDLPSYNVVGDPDEGQTEYWLVECGGAKPKIWSRTKWMEFFSGYDEVSSAGHYICVDGVKVWREEWGFESEHKEAPSNIFSRIAKQFPVVGARGLRFELGAAQTIDVEPMFEDEARPLREVLLAPLNQPSSFDVLVVDLVAGLLLSRNGAEPAAPKRKPLAP